MGQYLPGLTIPQEPNDLISIDLGVHKWGVIGQMDLTFPDSLYRSRATAEQSYSGNKNLVNAQLMPTSSGRGQLARGWGRGGR